MSRRARFPEKKQRGSCEEGDVGDDDDGGGGEGRGLFPGLEGRKEVVVARGEHASGKERGFHTGTPTYDSRTIKGVARNCCF